MNVWVFLGSRRLTALLDSGSSKTFINTRVAEELRIPLYPDQALKVTVGNGDQVHSPGRLAEVRGMVGGDYFWFDSHSLPMGSLDMVIGVSWMSQLGDISWNFSEQTFAFRVADKRIMWCGVNRPGPASYRSISTKAGQLLPELLQEFQSLFVEPHGTPPSREIEHKIRLKQGTEAVAVRPYRYAHLQKDELEKQCADRLKQGIIRPSSSAFSSPALLVCKPDNSWRLCIDYRALNACTVKDKFPIPVAEELFGELRGAKYFTKLDLRSGYYQMRDRLEQAQQYSKVQYDRKHRELSFEVGQWVWLRLLHRPVASLGVQGRGKLGPRYFGPYKVLERIGDVAYRLDLPRGARLHDVFHVGLLKPFRGTPPDAPPLPPIQNGRACPSPAKVLQGRLARGRYELLVQWQNQDAASASWVALEDFRRSYPDFQLVSSSRTSCCSRGERCYDGKILPKVQEEGKSRCRGA